LAFASQLCIVQNRHRQLQMPRIVHAQETRVAAACGDRNSVSIAAGGEHEGRGCQPAQRVLVEVIDDLQIARARQFADQGLQRVEIGDEAAH
jgi:hypothetical protein